MTGTPVRRPCGPAGLCASARYPSRRYGRRALRWSSQRQAPGRDSAHPAVGHVARVTIAAAPSGPRGEAGLSAGISRAANKMGAARMQKAPGPGCDPNRGPQLRLGLSQEGQPSLSRLPLERSRDGIASESAEERGRLIAWGPAGVPEKPLTDRQARPC
jgi:hypothetical protein